MECFSQLVQGRDYLWWVGQFGILLEILGAVFIVIAAFNRLLKYPTRTRGTLL